MNALIKKSFAVVATISCLLIFSSCTPQPSFSKPSIVHQYNETEASVRSLWSVNEVYVKQNDFQPMMSTFSDLICVLGDLKYPPQKDITCLNSEEGTVAWQKEVRIPSGILLDADGVYVSNGGTAGVKKFDHSGSLIWDFSSFETSAKYMYLYNNQLQLFLLPEKFMALNKYDGSEIFVVDGERIIRSTDTERFVVNYSLESKSLDLQSTNWELSISSANIQLAPLITNGLILIRTGSVIGALLAINHNTGQIAWETESDIVSNIAYWTDNETLFALTKSGDLLRINANDGAQTILLSFRPSPFILYGEDVVGGYELAFNENNNILYVLLGDSRQLFAFVIE